MDTSRPSNSMVPEVGRSSAISSLASVLLPHPDSPTSPSVSPFRSPNDTPSTALACPTCRRNSTPSVSGKCFVRPSTRRISSATEHLLGEVTGAAAPLHLAQLWNAVRAHVLRPRAAGVERAARRDRGQVRRRAGDRGERPAAYVD